MDTIFFIRADSCRFVDGIYLRCLRNPPRRIYDLWIVFILGIEALPHASSR